MSSCKKVVQVVNLTQNKAPLWEALCAYRKHRIVPFHTPGHKLRADLFPRLEEQLGSGTFALDPSDEIESLDFDHDFEAALEAAQELAAQLFNADNTLFLVNGTTSGLHYLLYFMSGPVVIPRFSHQSVYTGVMLSGSESIYLPARFDPHWQIPLQPSPDEFSYHVSGRNPAAAVFTHPTYYGTCGQLADLIQRVHQEGALAFVDEAHGGHFHFSRHYPQTALAAGADGVAQSTHKTLGSLTQTSMLHVRSKELYQQVKKARHILETTSPSLVFLAVLDEVRRTLYERGQILVEDALALAEGCCAELETIPGVEVLPPHLRSDPTKVVFSLRKLGLTGIQLEGLLRKDYNIQVELSDYYNVIALITIGDSQDQVTRLCEAIRLIAKRAGHLGGSALKRPKFSYPELPEVVFPTGKAVRLPCEVVPLTEAEGRVSGSFVTPYPPGVPLLVPGELVSQDTIAYLRWCISLGWPIRGLEGSAPNLALSVIKDNAIC